MTKDEITIAVTAAKETRDTMRDLGSSSELSDAVIAMAEHIKGLETALRGAALTIADLADDGMAGE